MRAYRCDACRKVFMLPDKLMDSYGRDDDTFLDVHIPGSLYIYLGDGRGTDLDLCKDCLEKVVTTIECIGGNAEFTKTLNLFYKEEVHE